jgi:hypothetical protein
MSKVAIRKLLAERKKKKPGWLLPALATAGLTTLALKGTPHAMGAITGGMDALKDKDVGLSGLFPGIKKGFTDAHGRFKTDIWAKGTMTANLPFGTKSALRTAAKDHMKKNPAMKDFKGTDEEWAKEYEKKKGYWFEESNNIKSFIKTLGEKNYSTADKYLKKIIEDKLQSKISKQYQLQKLY